VAGRSPWLPHPVRGGRRALPFGPTFAHLKIFYGCWNFSVFWSVGRAGGSQLLILVSTMKVRVEILRWDGGEQPRVVHSLSHESHALPAVQATIENVLRTVTLPEAPHGYRIITEGGTELYGWAD